MNQNKIVAFSMAGIVAISIVAMAMPALGGEDKAKEMPEDYPVFRDVVIVYFNEMPASLDEFASTYGVTQIFVKEDIKMAAFETEPIGRPGETSQRTLEFIEAVSKDSCVEKAYKDGSMFVRADKVYTPEPEMIYPEDYDKKGWKYVPNNAMVGFWRLPPSLEEFASRYDAKLKNFGEANEVLLFATFETDDITEFIKRVSTDPYVRHAVPNGVVHGSYTPDDPRWNQQWGPKEIDQDPYVRHAEPNSAVHVTYTPDDPKWNPQWGPNMRGQRIYIAQKQGNTGKVARISRTIGEGIVCVHKEIPVVKEMDIVERRGRALYKYPQKN